MKFFLIFLSLCFFGDLDGKEYSLAICAIFNDEADYLQEWIEYHLHVGVEHFYLYNNNSKDDYLNVLFPYIAQGIVDCTEWPSPQDQDWVPYQIGAYNHCLKNSKAYWLAIIDIDEFIVPVNEDNILAILSEFKDFGGLKVFWQNYGTSFLPSLPPDRLMIESLIWKYPWDHERNRTGKTIIQPKKVKKCSIHDHEYFPGHFAVTETGANTYKAPISIDKIRINHYWTRAEDYFFGQKIPRMERHDGKPVPQEKIDHILFECNQVEDPIILKLVSHKFFL